MNPSPYHIVYMKSTVQRGFHKVEQPTLVLLVKGYRHCRLLGPGGVEFWVYDGCTPTLLLAAPGMRIDYATTPERENGYIEFINDEVRLGDKGSVEIIEQGDRIEVPCHLPLSPEETSILRDEFETIYRLWKAPIPHNVFRIKAGITGLLCRFLSRQDAGIQPEMQSPAQELRRRMDADLTLKFNLTELSRQCGYSEDHLRKLFRERYHVSPMDYRQRQRMRHAMELLLATDLSLPEVAQRTGFRHLSHFCTSFRHAFGMSPLQHRKRSQGG